MTAYYNEFDPYAAAWLENLIAAGHIAPGEVDTRSIEDVRPDDLIGFKQCHFFAGIGVWSLALRRAGWPDDRPVWTGSCPCQPFSAAGAGLGFADERHLWPAFNHLIAQHRPAVVLGEQVASAAVAPWIDLVHADLEALGYAFGAVAFPSAGVGAPHIRDRTYWVADAQRTGVRGRSSGEHSAQAGAGDRQHLHDSVAGGDAGRLADAGGAGSLSGAHAGIHRGEDGTRSWHGELERQGSIGWLADANDGGRVGRGSSEASDGRDAPRQQPERLCDVGGPTGPTNGFWRDADWLGCRDDRWRPVESRPQPLVDGSAESLGRVRTDAIEEIEKEINATTTQSKGGRAAAMRDLLIYLSAEAERGWPAGRLPGLHEAPFLLSFLRQLQEQGWRIAEGIALPRPEAAQAYLRVLRNNAASPSAPREYGLAGQQPGERANAVHFLSSLLARHAHTAWDHAYSTYAEIGFPLAHGARSRVGRLRAYGNAINAEAARVFIKSVMECLP